MTSMLTKALVLIYLVYFMWGGVDSWGGGLLTQLQRVGEIKAIKLFTFVVTSYN